MKQIREMGKEKKEIRKGKKERGKEKGFIRKVKQMAVVMMIMVFGVMSGYAQESGIDFTGSGIEPMWNVKIDTDGGIFFTSETDGIKIETPKPKFVPIMDVAGWSYDSKTDDFVIQVEIMKGDCTSGYEDVVYPYSVRVMITRISDKSRMEYKGCGKYEVNEMLNNEWAVVRINGRDVTENDFMKVKPFMKFDVSENKVAGKSGCNNFFGEAEVQGDKIKFGYRFGATLMACPNMEFEREFMKTITGKTFDYRIDGDKLYLTENGETVMELIKNNVN